MDHHGVLSFNCPRLRLGLTGEVESDYAENLGYGMIAFAAFGAVGYSVCFLYSWHKDIKDFNEELGDEHRTEERYSRSN